MLTRRSTAIDIERRIEALPLTRWHWITLTALGIAQGVEAIDSLAASFALPVFIEMWKLTPAMAGLLLSSMYTGQMLGAGAGGWISDRVGRLSVLRWSMIGLVIIGLLVACSWSFESFVLLRFLQGLAMGGVLLMAATYLGEVSASSYRGRLIFGLNAIFSAGVIVAGLIATYIVPHFGWRWIFVIAALASVPFFLLGRKLPESPRWLAVRGRISEAEEIVGMMETRARAAGLAVSSPDSSTIAAAPTSATGGLSHWSELLSAEYRLRTILLWVMALSIGIVGTSLLTWLPTIYRKAYTISLAGTLGMSTISYSASLVGSLLGAVVIDRIGRARGMITGFTGMCVSLFLLWQSIGIAPIEVAVALSFATFFFQVLLYFSTNLVMVEFYPTRLRGTGAGACRVWLGISAIVGPLIAGIVVGAFGAAAVMVYLFSVAVAGWVAVMILRRNWPSLEHIRT